MAFDKVTGHLIVANHPDFQPGRGDFTLAQVVIVNDGSGPIWDLSPKLVTAGSELVLSPTQACFVFGIGVKDGCTAPPMTLDSKPHILVVRRASDKFTLRVDGAIVSSVMPGSPVNINVLDFQSQLVNVGVTTTMRLGELVYVIGPMADKSLVDLEKYLMTKFMITP